MWLLHNTLMPPSPAMHFTCYASRQI